jgi:hypothetical protein
MLLLNLLHGSGLTMDKTNNRGGGRTFRSALGKILSVGACSALLVTGVVLATATAASAAGAPAKVVFTTEPTSPTTAGSPLASFAVSIEDGSSALVATSTDTILITSSCSLAGTMSVAAVGGVATFTAVAINTGTSCTLLATDTTENLTTDTSSVITVNPTTLAKVGFTTQPTSPAVSGNNMATFRVATEDTYGNVIASGVAATDTITITSACTLGGTLSAVAAAGVATFSTAIIYGGTSPCTLTATDSTRTLTAAVSSGVTVTAGTATKVEFSTQPPATVVASAVLATFKVSVEDGYGNVETTGTDATDTIALTPSTGCTFGGTTSAVALAGVATFSALTITSTGSCTLTATDSTHVLTTTVSSAVDSQGAQAALTVSSITGFLGSPLTLTTAGGSGTGAVTFTAVPGTALGCVVTGTSLTVTSLGTCLVTATKAASLTNLAASSVATTVTFVKPFKAVRVVGFVVAGKTSIITIIGTAFSGRPTVTSHAGTTAIVFKDTGTALSVRVKVKAGSRNGTYTFTVKLANGKTSKVKYIQRA